MREFTKFLLIVVIMVGLGFWLIYWDDRRHTATEATNRAVARMTEVVEQDNPAAVVIACGNTSDPIACVVEKESGGEVVVVITYYAGDNANRTPFATRRVHIETRARLRADSISFQ